MTHIICTPIYLININNSKLVFYDFHIKTMYGLSDIYVMCIYIRLLVFNTISVSDDVRVVQQ